VPASQRTTKSPSLFSIALRRLPALRSALFLRVM